MEIIGKSFEETVYRLDVLGDAVEFVAWNCNSVKVAVPKEDVFVRHERAIRNIMNCAGRDVW
jgi:hypothetical protein